MAASSSANKQESVIEHPYTSFDEPVSTLDVEKNTITDNASLEDSILVDNNVVERKEEFAYTRREEFTSEIFKIEIKNLARHGFVQLKKLMSNLELKPVKIKVIPKANYTFATFRCEEDRKKALEVLNGYLWKGRTMKVKYAQPSADPLVQKRKLEASDGKDSKKRKSDTADESIPILERLRNVVTPLWKRSYKEQLDKKQAEMEQVIVKLGSNMKKQGNGLTRAWLKSQRPKYNGLCCELLPIKESPTQEFYRNKVEFTIGKHPETSEATVGFRLGKYKGGVCGVVEPTECTHLPQVTIGVAKAFQNYIGSSTYEVYDPELGGGHWRQLLVRTSRLNEVMTVVGFHPQTISKEDISKELDGLRDYFTTGDGSLCTITSMYFQEQADKNTGGISDKSELNLLFGSHCITETLLDMKFRISPEAFFQVNTEAAEILYSTVIDWCNIQDKTTVFDICCGTGTIGISAVKLKGAGNCISIEMNKEAIKDAKHNAVLNGVLDKVEIFCSKAEALLPQIMQQMQKNQADVDTVAVVDPPRAGLHQKVIQAIRKSGFVRRLVYVACNANSAMTNYIDLTRPESNRIKGDPFLPVKAIPVDLFPQTPHCELVILFER